MTSRTSFFNGAILKKNLTRFAPVWILYTVGLMIAYPLYLSSNYLNDLEFGMHYLRMLTGYGGAVANFGAAVVIAACCFKYLYQTRSAYMLHAFPVTRESLFRTNLFSGLLMGTVPMLAALSTCALTAVMYSYPVVEVFYCIGLYMLQFLFFYGLAVFCMHLAGQLVSAVLLYGTLNFLAIGLELLIRAILEPLMYGYVNNGYYTLRFSPLAAIMTGTGTFQYGYLGILAGVGVVLLVLSCLLYRKRRMETCGEFIAYRSARPVFQYLFTLVVTLLLGLILSLIVYGDIDLLSTHAVGTVFCMLVAAFIGLFVAEALLNKSLRVFCGKTFAKYGLFALLLATTLAAFRCDWFGIVSYVPSPSKVASVSISPNGCTFPLTLSEQEDIARVTELHALFTESRTSYYNGEVRLSYKLKNGRTVTREYWLSDEMYSGTAAYEASQKLLALLQEPRFAVEYYKSIKLEEAHYVDLEYPVYYEQDGYYAYSEYMSLNSAEQAKLREMLLTDAADGNLSVSCAGGSYYSYGPDCDNVYNLYFGFRTRGKAWISIPAEAKATVAFLDSLIPSE